MNPLNTLDLLDDTMQKLETIHRRLIVLKHALEFCVDHVNDTEPSVIQDVARKALAYTEK